MYFHGTDADGAYRPSDLAAQSGVQDRICGALRGKEAGGEQTDDPQLCGFCADL